MFSFDSWRGPTKYGCGCVAVWMVRIGPKIYGVLCVVAVCAPRAHLKGACFGVKRGCLWSLLLATCCFRRFLLMMPLVSQRTIRTMNIARL